MINFKKKGGILFVDEAYNLGVGPYGKEACDTLVAAMTREEYKDLVIVIAGYEADIDKMLNGNSGLKSRFTEYFNFPDWDTNDCVQFFNSLAKKENFVLSAGINEVLFYQCDRLMKLDGWGNGRDITRIWKKSLEQRASRIAKSNDMERCIEGIDVEEALGELISAREPKKTKLMGSGVSSMFHTLPTMESKKSFETPNITREMSRKEAVEEDNTEINEVERKGKNERDEGVPDEIWDELQIAKEEERLLKIQQDEYIAFSKLKLEEERLAKIAFEQKMERIKRELEEAEIKEEERILFEEEERKKSFGKEETGRRGTKAITEDSRASRGATQIA